MRNFFKAVVGIFFLGLILTGCNNTVQGVGKDMQDNGKAIQKSAEQQ